VIISVTVLLLFGDIVPTAVCTKYGLAIGSRCRYLVYFLMAVFSPVAYPIAKLLDVVLGEHGDSFYRRDALKAIIDLHARSPENFEHGLSPSRSQACSWRSGLEVENRRASHATAERLFYARRKRKGNIELVRCVGLKISLLDNGKVVVCH
jgi:hypothetical protein